MSYPAVAPAPTFGYGLIMPMPGPLGRLVRRRRLDLEMTQWQLSDRTAELGCRVPQNTISRLESGATHRINKVDYLSVLGNALGYSNDRDFIVAAYGAKGTAAVPDDTPLPDMGLLVRTLAVSFELDERETEKLRRFVEHVRETANARGPSPEERIASYARRIVAERRPDRVPTT